MPDLKKVFDAARKIRDHTIPEAADAMGYSDTTINKFFAGELPYPDRPKRAITRYIYESGLRESVENLRIDPEATKESLTSHE